MSQLCAIGIDVGSATVKLVGTDVRGQLIWQLLENTHPRIEDQVMRLLDQTRAENEYPANCCDACP